MSAHRLVVVALALPALGLGGQLPDPAMIGTWSGDAQIVVNWTDQPSIHVRLDILADGSVSGQVEMPSSRMGAWPGTAARSDGFCTSKLTTLFPESCTGASSLQNTFSGTG